MLKKIVIPTLITFILLTLIVLLNTIQPNISTITNVLLFSLTMVHWIIALLMVLSNNNNILVSEVSGPDFNAIPKEF